MSSRPQFDLFAGVDYSGARTPLSRSQTLQVYATDRVASSEMVKSPAATSTRHRSWNRKEIADWIVSTVMSGTTLIVGVDHGFSFPITYFERYGISSWDDFLDDFVHYWPTDGDNITVDTIRHGDAGLPNRTGANTDLRLCEKWTPSAKSVFLFDVQGSVAKSTHAGLPWLRHIRSQLRTKVHFWPYDGWEIPEGKSVIAEVYPSVFRRRFPVEERSPDQHDAYSVSEWLATAASSDILKRYLDPPLSKEERETANLEGWILGVC